MKKLLIIIFFICISCNSYKIDLLQNSIIYNPEISKEQISIDLNSCLHRYKKQWSELNKKICVDSLYAGYREFNIDYKVLLTIIGIESQFTITAIGKNSKSFDYGLTQQNSEYYKCRYKASEDYLKFYNIPYSNDYYDIGKNIFSCYMYLHDISLQVRNVPETIKAYNVGVRGLSLYYYQDEANNYLNKFIKEYQKI